MLETKIAKVNFVNIYDVVTQGFLSRELASTQRWIGVLLLLALLAVEINPARDLCFDLGVGEDDSIGDFFDHATVPLGNGLGLVSGNEHSIAFFFAH